MSDPAHSGRDQFSSSPRYGVAPTPGMRHSALQFVASLAEAVADLLKLFTLEGRMTAVASFWTVALGVVMGLLAMTLWLLLLALTGLGLRELGLGWPAVLLVLMVITLAGMGVAWLVLRRLTARIGFDATLSVLKRHHGETHE